MEQDVFRFTIFFLLYSVVSLSLVKPGLTFHAQLGILVPLEH